MIAIFNKKSVGARIEGIGLSILVSPILIAVSLVALPIIALVGSFIGFKHRSLYQKTLTDGSRAEYGRIEGQDYTRWDGKVTQTASKPGWFEKLGVARTVFPKGETTSNDSNFKTQEDFDWLKNEYKRRKVEEKLDVCLGIAKMCALGIIPLVGPLLVYLEAEKAAPENARDGESTKGMHGNFNWNWKQAINHHCDILKKSLPAAATVDSTSI